MVRCGSAATGRPAAGSSSCRLAAGEAALTGELAVCAVSCGPGNLHLINGLFDADRSAVPVPAITAHIPRTEIGGDYFQETHPQELKSSSSSPGRTPAS